MRAVEVIREIRKLPREKLQKVMAFLGAAQEAGLPGLHSEQAVSNECRRVADEVFTTNAGLFRRLAK